MSAGAIKAQGLLLLLHRYRWILPSICIHHGWHVFHGGTAVTGVRQSSIIPGLTVPNLLYRPSSSLRQKFLFLPPPISTKRSKMLVFARFLYCCTRINTFQNNKKDSGRSRILYARHNSKKKKKKISITSFPNNSDFIRQLSNNVIVRWISLKRSTHRYAYEFLLSKFSTFMIVPRMRGTRKESVLQNSKISE